MFRVSLGRGEFRCMTRRQGRAHKLVQPQPVKKSVAFLRSLEEKGMYGEGGDNEKRYNERFDHV